VDYSLAYMDDTCLAVSSTKNGDSTNQILSVQDTIQAQSLSCILVRGK
jgi:hypothetical protein